VVENVLLRLGKKKREMKKYEKIKKFKGEI
jgi:hypothetical protein